MRTVALHKCPSNDPHGQRESREKQHYIIADVTVVSVFAPSPEIEDGELFQRLHGVDFSQLRIGILFGMVHGSHAYLQDH